MLAKKMRDCILATHGVLVFESYKMGDYNLVLSATFSISAFLALKQNGAL